MGDVKRWSVTYTKHIKQKRKVYQDGFLELRDSSRKVMLYDDSEKLLESRLVKKDDVFSSGETLELQAYLVDIGDPDGVCKPIPNLDIQGRDEKITEKAGLFHVKKFKDSSAAVGSRKVNCGKSKAQSNNLSPSQKLIGEYKKNERNKYGAPPSSPSTIKPSYTEWQVLYTTQITQKAKKYHDGILRVATCGSQGRQATLYDVSRRHLDSKFLKKDEVIQSGESLAFDGHLVDIGEPDVDLKPSIPDLKVQYSNCSTGDKTGVSHGPQASRKSCIDNGNSGSKSMSPMNDLKDVKTTREWHVLYTTQITQKAKKYHSGILRLTPCNSYQMQATLLNEVRNVLSRMYLKLSEDVRSGSTFELSNYLVDVGEPLTTAQGEPPEFSSAGRDVESGTSSTGLDNLKMGRASMDKPLRDANGILSILRKSKLQEGSVLIESVRVEHSHASQSSNLIKFDLQNQEETLLLKDTSFERTQADNRGQKTTIEFMHNPACPDDLTTGVIKPANSENTDAQPKYCTPLSCSLRSGTSDFSSPNLHAKGTGMSIFNPVSSSEEPQAKFNYPDDLQSQTASVPDDGSYRNMEGDSLKSMSSKAASGCQGDQFSEEVDTKITTKSDVESTDIPNKWKEESFSCDINNSRGCMSHVQSDMRRPGSEVHKSTSKIDEIPSFDLGF